jgi:hypothetical protein
MLSKGQMLKSAFASLWVNCNKVDSSNAAWYINNNLFLSVSFK